MCETLIKRKMGLKEYCAVGGRVQRAMVKIVTETLQWSGHVLFKNYYLKHTSVDVRVAARSRIEHLHL